MDAVCENAGLAGLFYDSVNLDMEVKTQLDCSHAFPKHHNTAEGKKTKSETGSHILHSL